MAIDYTGILSDDQKRSILDQRITEFAAVAYQHSLNVVMCEQAGDEKGVAANEKALAELEAAINVHKAELATLPPATPAE